MSTTARDSGAGAYSNGEPAVLAVVVMVSFSPAQSTVT
jgi:hypothetical protein